MGGRPHTRASALAVLGGFVGIATLIVAGGASASPGASAPPFGSDLPFKAYGPFLAGDSAGPQATPPTVVGIACGEERWPIKTLSDRGLGQPESRRHHRERPACARGSRARPGFGSALHPRRADDLPHHGVPRADE